MKVGGKNIYEVTQLTIRECDAFFGSLELTAREQKIAGQVLKEIDARLGFLITVGLDYLTLARAAGTLSGGWKQRLALAACMLHEPQLLLLDEPTAGLDPNGSDEFCELLRDIHNELGLTVIMVTHDLDTLFALSTRVAVLAEKRVLFTGAPRDVARIKHPFIEHFFQGERGRRAMAPVQGGAAAEES